MNIKILTLFPEFFESPFKASLLGKAIEQAKIQVSCISLRPFGEGKHLQVDDRPFGGGAGMVIMPQVIERALAATLTDTTLDTLQAEVTQFKTSLTNSQPITKLPSRLVVYLSPQGILWSNQQAINFSEQVSELILLCGHYEGIDQRVIDLFCHLEVSIGDYILTGGEPAALVLIDALARFLPGVIGDKQSVLEDTFSTTDRLVQGGLKYPMYTRPQVFRNQEVPAVLLSGNHAEIANWRQAQSVQKTKVRRPDLLVKVR